MSMAIQLPADVDTTPADESLYLGLSRQDLKFHQALGELIDNAISCSPSFRPIIEILIERHGEFVNILVADSGTGIAYDELRNNILKIGGRGNRRGRLNEHGFGLKNALCVLTRNELPSRIVTRDQQAPDEDMYLSVDGPFRFNPKMQIEQAPPDEWKEKLVYCTADTGTRISARTTMKYFRTLYRGNSSFENTVERLLEHLGVMYRGFLSETKGDILLRWRDVSEKPSAWIDWPVQAIPVPFKEQSGVPIEVHYEGKKHVVTYTWGTIDINKVRNVGNEKPYPLKIYYQGNLSTQGVDIRVRGRVILMHMVDYLWSEIKPHNDLNDFVGELVVEDPVFSTVNNKIQLDPNNPVWELVVEHLQDRRFRPSEAIKGSQKTEAELRRHIMQKLEAYYSGSKAKGNVPTWEGVGVEIDILHTLVDKQEDIYELKTGQARPLDVYQLVMYWDARVEERVRPKLGRLVAKSCNNSVHTLIEYWNERKDRHDENYHLEYVSADDL